MLSLLIGLMISYEDKGIYEARDLITDKDVYLKYSSISGWRVVYPWWNKDGSFNWENFIKGGGGRFGNWLGLLLILILVMGMIMSYRYDINNVKNNYEEISKDPKAFCEKLIPKIDNSYKLDKFNYSSINITS